MIESGATNTTVTDTVIDNNNGAGVEITGANTEHNSLTDDFIGTNAGGEEVGNLDNGVQITSPASDNTIGGTTSGSANVIGNNYYSGVDITGSAATGNVVEGNDIGAYLGSSNVNVGSAGNGVLLENGANFNTVGGTTAAAGNLIGYNNNNGVAIVGTGTEDNTVEGNSIGVSASGTQVGNSYSGVAIYAGASKNTIGGTVAGAGNVIGENGQDGVYISDSGTSGNLVAGDDIGVASNGSTVLPNATGVYIGNGATDNTIGGTTTAARNVISGNMGDGVDLNGSGVTGNLVEGNYIGTNSNSGTGLGNYDGVEIENAATYNTIGGTTAAARNVISGNNWDGVHIVDTGTKDNLVEGNYIGVTVGGSGALGNVQSGVAIYAAASANTIGGTVSAAANVLSGNDSNGVYISDSGTTGNVVDADYIGTNYNGTSAVPNNTGVVIQNGATGNRSAAPPPQPPTSSQATTQDGVDILDSNTEKNAVEGDDIGLASGDSATLGNGGNGVAVYESASDNTIGGSVTGAGDVISGNGGSGMYISGASNTVDGDIIGTNSSGAKSLGNLNDGVLLLLGATDNTIGGTTTAARDVISGNDQDGVDIFDSDTMGNVVEGSDIGATAGASAALANGGTGVAIFEGASCNTIGGSVTGAGDVISGNSESGVSISDSGTTGNVVDGDDIGTNSSGANTLGNSINGVLIQDSATCNTIGGTTTGARDVISGNLFGVQILFGGTSSNVVEGDYIGINPGGTAALGNYYGVYILGGADYNTIGGTTAADRDVISGNTEDGVHIVDLAAYNTVDGDYIGVSPGGNTALGNEASGVAIYSGAYDNTIGGSVSGSGNVISGNSGYGVYIYSSTTYGNVVDADDIGTNANGASALPNGTGVTIQGGALQNIIGGTVSGARDVISGNTNQGVWISGADTNGVEGDYIGLSSSGTRPPQRRQRRAARRRRQRQRHRQQRDGQWQCDLGQHRRWRRHLRLRHIRQLGRVELYRHQHQRHQRRAQLRRRDHPEWGDQQLHRRQPDASLPEVISGNSWDGVHIVGSGTDGNVVFGVYIGVNVKGTGALGNVQSGVAIYAGASNNTVGGMDPGNGNVISGNGSNGVYISDSGTTGNAVQGNLIGTNVSGTSALPNYYGVLIQNGAAGNLIGGTVAAPRNVISGNTEDGVHIVDSGTTGNQVEGNYIGTSASGSSKLGNGASGVAIYASASGNTIGGSVAGSGNVVSGNGGDGFYISGGGTNANVVEGDYIGTDYTGSVAVPNDEGVYLGGGATNNTIGGTTAVTRDVISGNTTNGVEMFSVGTAGNVVEGDYIGVTASGSAKLGNGSSGVAIHGGANNNTVGGTASGSGNVISGNVGNGVYIADPGTMGNVVEGNLIGTDYTGTVSLGNGVGVYIGNGATENTIGGTVSAARDVISGNFADGVDITGSGTSANVVEGDYIGVTASGSSGLGNGVNDLVDGVSIAGGVAIFGGASSNTIGGSAKAAGNVISGNGLYGVNISDPGTQFNYVDGADIIGLNASASAKLGNDYGVIIQNGATSNNVGALSYYFTIVAGNITGIRITGDGTNLNRVWTCDVGTNASGASNLGNAENGVSIDSGASSNAVEGGTIADNGGQGIEVDSTNTTGTEIYEVTIDNNGGDGVYINYAASTTIDYCTIENNVAYGVVDTGSGTTYNDDTVIYNGLGGIIN